MKIKDLLISHFPKYSVVSSGILSLSYDDYRIYNQNISLFYLGREVGCVSFTDEKYHDIEKFFHRDLDAIMKKEEEFWQKVEGELS